MNFQDLCTALQLEFGLSLKPEPRVHGKGVAYYWRDKAGGAQSTRLVRIVAASDGMVSEIKLAQSSLGKPDDVVHPLPATVDQVVAAVHDELGQLLSR